MTVNSTDPIFFYCSQAGHCGTGMVGAVNPSSSQTLDAFRSAAQGKSSSSPANVFGGQVGPASGSTTTTTTSAGAAPPAQTTASGGGGGGGLYGGGGSPSGAGVAKISVAAVLGAAALAMFLV